MENEKILNSAPANVALESLNYRYIKECNTLDFKDRLSEPLFDADYRPSL